MIKDNALPGGPSVGITMGDAFLIYLRIFKGDDIGIVSGREVEKRLKSIQKEIDTAQNEESISLVESPETALHPSGLISRAEKLMTSPGSIITKVIPSLTYTPAHPLKAAFIYSRAPEESNWIYNHEAGRARLEKAFGGTVLTRALKEDEGGFDRAVGQAVSWGADVIFTPSVRQSTDTLRAAIRYQDVKFLNCSINLANQAVRTYYAKLYEAKFLAGIAAGAASAADGTHAIGYCSDMPIYGAIADINAFAIGAAMTDPKVRIYLEWDAARDKNWWSRILERGIHVISAVSSKHNTDGSNGYGVCYVDRASPDEATDVSGLYRITNLAVPIWKWGKLYEIIVRTILDGTYHAHPVDRKDQATNYWWGMISGVVDIEVTDAVPAGTRRLIDILRSDIIGGSLSPFDGDLRSQSGPVRTAADGPPGSMDIIRMDWLNENIIGELPAVGDLNDAAQEAVSISGVDSVREKR